MKVRISVYCDETGKFIQMEVLAPKGECAGQGQLMWYVMQVRTGTEETICTQCRQIVNTDVLERSFIPYCEEMKRYQGVWHKEKKVLFPGYVFLVSDKLDELYFQLKSVIGLTRLIGTGDEIVPLSQKEVDFLVKFGGETQIVGMSEGIIENDKVTVISGPLAGQEGCIKRIDRHKRKAYLELEMFGRTIETQVGLEIVEKK